MRCIREAGHSYNAGSFKKCSITGHSACLDQFPADGNMQFSEYNAP